MTKSPSFTLSLRKHQVKNGIFHQFLVVFFIIKINMIFVYIEPFQCSANSLFLFLFRVKSFELIFESYPQLILGIFVIHGLQLHEFTNILSCCISTVSVVKGFGDYLAFVVNDNQAGAPLKLTAWGMLASTLDSLFRAIFMAYVCTIIKGGII